MKKVILFALFCSLSVFSFANSADVFANQSNTAEELVLVQDVADVATEAIFDFDADTCTIKTKTTITNPDGSQTTVESETTISMSCEDLVKSAIKAIK